MHVSHYIITVFSPFIWLFPTHFREQLGKAHPLSFMYDPPPGYDKEQGECI